MRFIAALTLISFLSQQCLFAETPAPVQNVQGQYTPVVTPDQQIQNSQPPVNQQTYQSQQTPSSQDFLNEGPLSAPNQDETVSDGFRKITLADGANAEYSGGELQSIQSGNLTLNFENGKLISYTSEGKTENFENPSAYMDANGLNESDIESLINRIPTKQTEISSLQNQLMVQAEEISKLTAERSSYSSGVEPLNNKLKLADLFEAAYARAAAYWDSRAQSEKILLANLEAQITVLKKNIDQQKLLASASREYLPALRRMESDLRKLETRKIQAQKSILLFARDAGGIRILESQAARDAEAIRAEIQEITILEQKISEAVQTQKVLNQGLVSAQTELTALQDQLAQTLSSDVELRWKELQSIQEIAEKYQPVFDGLESNEVQSLNFSAADLTNQNNYQVSCLVDGVLQKQDFILREGANTISGSFQDAAGNRFSFSEEVFLDSIAPEVIVTSASITNQSAYTLNYTADDAAKTQSVMLAEGENIIPIVERDSAGNETKVDFKVTLDSTAPAIIFSSPVLTNNPNYTLIYTVDGVQKTKAVTLSEGENTLEVTESDALGNESKVDFKVTLDSASPSISFTSPVLTNNPKYILEYVADGAAKTQLAALNEGENTLNVVERDAAGNESRVSLKVTLDTVAPEVKFSSAVLTNHSNYTLIYTSEGIQKTKSILLVEGENTLNVVEADTAGNETHAHLKVVLDTIAPEIIFNSPVLTNQSSYTISYSTDGIPVTKSVTLVEGENTLDISEQDLAGNETKTSLKVTLDTIPPQLAVFSASLTNSSDYNLNYSSDGVPATKPITLQPGGNQIPLHVADAAGNFSDLIVPVYFAPDLPVFAAPAAMPARVNTDVPGLLSVALQDGSKIFYLNGNIHYIELADHSIIQNVTLGADGKISDAEIFLSDGRVQIVSEGKIIKGGLARASRAGDFEYLYASDHTWAVSENVIIRYNQDGKLEAIIKSDGTFQAFDTNSPNAVIPDTITLPDGSQIQFNLNQLNIVVGQNGSTSTYNAVTGDLTSVATDQGIFKIENSKVAELDLKDGSKVLDMDVDEQGNITKATILDPDGTYRTFENGELIRVLQPNGDIWTYANGQPEKLKTKLNLEYQFNYEPNQITADLINVDIAKSDTPIKLVYDKDFKLQWLKKKNDLLFKYESAGIFVYDPSNPDQETILDAQGNIEKVLVHFTIQNPVETEIRYRYGKAREVYENGILTKRYSYQYLSDGTEITVIENVLNHLIENYDNGVLISSLDPITEVLTTFSYDEQGRKKLVVKTRNGEVVDRFEYAYLPGQIQVTDKSGKISFFDAVKEKILKEIITDEKGNVSIFEYTHTKNEFLPNVNPFRGENANHEFNISGYADAEFIRHDGLYLYYKNRNTGEMHRLGPDFDYIDASGAVRPLDVVIAANVPIPESPFNEKEDEFRLLYPDAKHIFADGSFVFILKESEILAYRYEEGDLVRGWTVDSSANFKHVFYDWIHNEIWIQKEGDTKFLRLEGLRDLDGRETSHRELTEIDTVDGTKVRYKNGQVEEITKPNGTRAQNLVIDAEGKVVFAKYFNTDGSTEEIQGNTSIEIPQPDFSRKIYTRGKLEKWILIDGREIIYSYEATAIGERTLAKMGDWTYIYDESGKLSAVRIQNNEYAAEQSGTNVILTNRDEKLIFNENRQLEEYENLITHSKVFFKDGDFIRFEEKGLTATFEMGEVTGITDGQGHQISNLEYDQRVDATEAFRKSELLGMNDPRPVVSTSPLKKEIGYWVLTGVFTDMYDMNGDGILDKVESDSERYPGTWKVSFGRSDGSFQPSMDWGPVGNIHAYAGSWTRTQGWSIDLMNGRLGGKTTVLMDVNGDRLPDRVQTMGIKNDTEFESAGIFTVQLNNGHGFDQPVEWADAELSIPAAQSGSQIYFTIESNAGNKTVTAFRDLNGDGLADRIQAPPGSGVWKIQSNTGSGLDEMRDWSGIEYADWQSNLYDVDGDGLLDRVIKNPSTGMWSVQYNNAYAYEIKSTNQNLTLTKNLLLQSAGRYQFYARKLLPFLNVMEDLRLDMPNSEIILAPDRVTAGAKLSGGEKLWSVKTFADGRQFFYEGGALVRLKDVSGKLTDVIHESNGDMTLKDVDGERRFDISGNLISVTLPSGEKLTASAGKLTGRDGTYSLDANGKITSYVSNLAGWPETFTYENGSLVKLVNAWGETMDLTQKINFNRVPFPAAATFGPAVEMPQGTGSLLETDSSGYVHADLMDMNGDGIPDRVTQTSGARNYFEVAFGTGRGYLAPVQFGGVQNLGDASQGWIRVADAWGGAVRVDLFDITGDKLPDRVIAIPPTSSTGKGKWYIQRNNGHGFEPLEEYGPIENPGFLVPTDRVSAPEPWKYKTYISYRLQPDWTCSGNCGNDPWNRAGLTSMADVNGDGLPDRMITLQDRDPMYVQLNTGKGFLPAQIWEQNTENYYFQTYYDWLSFFHNGSQTMYIDMKDINGDGRVERILAGQAQTGFWLVQDGEADGLAVSHSIEAAQLSWDSPSSEWGDAIAKNQVMDLMDLNADGLLDRIYMPAGQTRARVQINLGGKFAPAQDWTGLPNLVINSSSLVNWWVQNITADFRDVTGDGLPDRVWRDAATGKWMMQENQTSPVAGGFSVFRAMKRTENLEKTNFAVEKLSFTAPEGLFSASSYNDNLSQYSLAPEAVAVSDYDESGNLLAVKKANGTTTLYENEKPTAVLNNFGELEIRYEYDANGDPTRIRMETARRRLPLEIERAKHQVEAKRLETLLKLASQKAVAVRDIRTKILSARLELEHALEELQRQQAYVSSINTRGVKKIVNIKANAMAQINGALGTVYATFTDIAHKEADAVAGVFKQVNDIKTQTDIDAQKAFDEIAVQQANIERELVRQEISPVIYRYYRDILGRDPSKAEYDNWISQTDFVTGTVGGIALAQAVKNFLAASAEKSVRESEIAAIKARIEFELTANPGSLTPEQLSAILAWIRSQDLHFGQSAWRPLEIMLEEAGIQYNHIDLVSKLVIADIRAGVLNPYQASQEKDLMISLFAMREVAASYGLQTFGIKKSFAGLEVGDILHINGDHFIVVTKVTADGIEYREPSAGPKGAEDLVTIKRGDLEQIWDGRVLSARAPPQNDQLLTDKEMRETRGAFFFLIPIFLGIWAGIAATVSAAIGAITAIVGGIISGIGSLLAGIGSFVGNLAALNFGAAFGGLFNGITGAFTASLGGFSSAFTTLQAGLTLGLAHGALGVPFIGQSLAAGILTHSSLVGGGILSLAGYGITKGLEAVGLSPKIINTIFSAGKIAFGAGLLVTGNPAGLSLIGGGVSNILGSYTNLNPSVIQAIGIGSQLVSGFAVGGASGLGKILPDITGQFASLGIGALGSQLGLDPRITSLISVGASAVGSGFANGILNGGGSGTILKSINDSILSGKTVGGLVSVGSAIGIDKISAPPIARDFLSGFLGSLASGAMGQKQEPSQEEARQSGEGLLTKVGKGISKFGTGIVNAAGSVVGFGAKVLGSLGQFTVGAFKGTLSSAGKFFSPKTQENLYQDQAGLRSGTVTIDGDVWRYENNGSRINYNSVTGEMTESASGFGTTRISGLGMNDSGSAYYEVLKYEESLFGGKETLIQIYERGALQEWSYGVEGAPAIIIRGPEQDRQWMNTNGDIERGTIEIHQSADEASPSFWSYFSDALLKLDIFGGKIAQADIAVNPVFQTGSQLMNEELYVLVNGIGNKEGENSPIYMRNFKYKIIDESKKFNDGKILNDKNDFVMASVYGESSVIVKALQQMLGGGAAAVTVKNLQDALKLLKSRAPGSSASSAYIGSGKDVYDAVEAHFDSFGERQWDQRLRSIVGVGYSGGFIPTVDGLARGKSEGRQSPVSLVGLGAATFGIGADLAGAIVGMVKGIENTATARDDQSREFYQNAMGLLGLALSGTAGLALDAVNLFMEQVDLMYESIDKATLDQNMEEFYQKLQRVIETGTLYDWTKLDAVNPKLVVNVWGTKDPIAFGNKIGGYRDHLGGYSVNNPSKPLFNIEIVGADHYDYIENVRTADEWAREYPDQTKRQIAKDRNKKISQFVAQMILNAETPEKLRAFLGQYPFAKPLNLALTNYKIDFGFLS